MSDENNNPKFKVGDWVKPNFKEDEYCYPFQIMDIMKSRLGDYLCYGFYDGTDTLNGWDIDFIDREWTLDIVSKKKHEFKRELDKIKEGFS